MLLSVVWSKYFTVSHICRGVAVIINQKMWLSSIDSDSVQLDFIIRLLLDLFPRGEFLHDQWHYKTFQFALNWTHVMPQSHLYASLFLEKKGSDISLIWLVKKDKPCGHWTRHLWSAWLCRWKLALFPGRLCIQHAAGFWKSSTVWCSVTTSDNREKRSCPDRKQIQLPPDQGQKTAGNLINYTGKRFDMTQYKVYP